MCFFRLEEFKINLSKTHESLTQAELRGLGFLGWYLPGPSILCQCQRCWADVPGDTCAILGTCLLEKPVSTNGGRAQVRWGGRGPVHRVAFWNEFLRAQDNHSGQNCFVHAAAYWADPIFPQTSSEGHRQCHTPHFWNQPDGNPRLDLAPQECSSGRGRQLSWLERLVGASSRCAKAAGWSPVRAQTGPNQ